MPGEFKAALEGVVVCDFAWVGAGSITTSVLAQLGAEVIKIETATRPDVLRLSGPFKDGIAGGLERSGYFASRNPNKRSISLNLSRPEAREAALRLIDKSDILINNFRAGQMEKWDLGWETVRRTNPRLIYVSMSLQGASGPHASFMGFGVNLNALCGLTERSAFPGRRPFGTGTHYTDHVMVPAHALFGIMAALMDREETGEGQAVEISQFEAALCMKPTDAMAWAANGELLGPLGFADPDAAPHGVFATLAGRDLAGPGQRPSGIGAPGTPSAPGTAPDTGLGEINSGLGTRSAAAAPGTAPAGVRHQPPAAIESSGDLSPASDLPRWIAIAVFTDEQWAALRQVMGEPAWAGDPRFDTLESRKRNEEDLNRRIEEWTGGQEARELAAGLCAAGVSAGVVHDARGVIEDEHLNQRGFWCRLDHPEMSSCLYNRAPLVLSETPVRMRSAAPLLGEHTREVLTGFLGYTDEEVDRLIEEGVLL